MGLHCDEEAEIAPKACEERHSRARSRRSVVQICEGGRAKGTKSRKVTKTKRHYSIPFTNMPTKTNLRVIFLPIHADMPYCVTVLTPLRRKPLVATLTGPFPDIRSLQSRVEKGSVSYSTFFARIRCTIRRIRVEFHTVRVWDLLRQCF